MQPAEIRPLLAGFNARERIQLVRSARQQRMTADWCEAVQPLLDDVPQEDLKEREQAHLKLLLKEFYKECA